MTEQNDAAAGPAQTDANDWRVTVRLAEAGQASKAVEHLSAHKVEDAVHRRLGGRVVVGASGGNEVFLYTRTQDAAAAARESVADLLAGHGMQAEFTIERWHPVAEEWEAAEAPLPETPAEVQAERQELDASETSDSLAAGVAPLLPWWIPAGQPPSQFFDMIGRHPGVPVMLAWSVVLFVTILLCIDPESRDYLLGHGRTLSLVSTGMLLLVLTMTVVGWSLTY